MCLKDRKFQAPSFTKQLQSESGGGVISLVGDLNELKGSSGWLENENGENRFGFNAKPNDEAGTCGFWWTSTEIEMTDPENPKVYAHNIEMYGNAQMDCFVSNPFKEYGFNVRCIKDETK